MAAKRAPVEIPDAVVISAGKHRWEYVAREPVKVRNFHYMEDDATEELARAKARRVLRSADFMLVGDEVRD